MNRVLIVDDEFPARERLGRLLTASGQALAIDYATNGFEALEKIALCPPDILFLDIQMPGMTGFEVLQNIEKRQFQVIFQTAYDQFAIRAFEESACDYLLKPYEAERLQKALKKALAGVDARSTLEKLELSIRATETYLERIAIKQGNKIVRLDVRDIHYFTSRDHYTCVYTSDKDYVSDLSLSHLEARLDPKIFYRCHRSHLVALSKIASLGLGPRMMAKLVNGATIEVSRQNRSSIKGLLINRK